MFDLDGKEFHVSRGDSGRFDFRLSELDNKKYIKYKDEQDNIYWYDAVNNVLYDSEYNKSDVDIKTLTMVFVNFNVNDEIRFNIYEKNGYNKTPVLSKLYTVTTPSDKVTLSFTEEDTTIGEEINKSKIYWYDITLNNDKTVVCYNKDGPKIFKLYPAKGVDENNG